MKKETRDKLIKELKKRFSFTEDEMYKLAIKHAIEVVNLIFKYEKTPFRKNEEERA